MRGREKIVAAGYERYALKGIVDHNGQMVGRRDFLACQHNVAKEMGIDGYCSMLVVWSRAELFEGQRASARNGFGAVQPQRVGYARCDPLQTLRLVQVTAGAGIEGSFRSMWRFRRARDLSRNLSACAEAWIQKLLTIQHVECRPIGIEPFGLVKNRRLP